MNILDKIGTGIDRTIGILSPRHEITRRLNRERLTKIRSGKYAAAKTDRLTGAWSPVDSNINTIIGNSSATIRARVRQLVRDFPYFARAVNILTDYTVGSGIHFQSRVAGPDGKLNKPLIQKIEDAFKFWTDEADISGKLSYYELMRLAKRQDIESGEFLFIKTYRKDPSRYLPYALQAYEADWLTTLGAQPSSKGNEVKQGIEYEKSTGRIIAYHFTDPDSWGKTKRIPAGHVIHAFEFLRPGQLRGISPFSPAVLVAHDLNSYMDSEMDAAKMASKYLAFIKTPDPLMRQAGVGTYTDDDTDQKIEEMQNAILEYMRPGEDVEITSNPRPGSNFSPFVKLILCMVSVTINVPYELLSGDYQGMSFSTSMTVRSDFAHQLKPISKRHIQQYGQPTMRAFFDTAVLTGKLDLPGYFTNPGYYLKCDWQPPGMENVNQLRETKSRIDEIKVGLRSPQEIVLARGRDLEDIYKEIAGAKEMAEEMGLKFEDVSTSMKNNPAAIQDKADKLKLIGGVKS